MSSAHWTRTYKIILKFKIKIYIENFDKKETKIKEWQLRVIDWVYFRVIDLLDLIKLTKTYKSDHFNYKGI